LKSHAHLIINARNGKNLTHLQSILLFKDSSERQISRNLDGGAASPAAHFERNEAQGI